MYYYILDQQRLSPEKFERVQIELQGLLAEFNISGEFARVTSLRSMTDCIDTASQRGTKTLVACGTDDTFNLMLAQLGGRDFTLAFIPFEPDSYLAKILGIPDIRSGVKTIAGRRIEKIDVARVGNFYFISSLEFGVTSQNLKHTGLWSSLKMLSAPGKNLTIRIDNSYTLDLTCIGGLVVNTRSTSHHAKSLANPMDGYLDLLIMEKLKTQDILRHRNHIVEGVLEQVPRTTVIKCRRVDFLEPTGFPLTISNRILTKFPATVEIIPKRLRLIVGKNRTF